MTPTPHPTVVFVDPFVTVKYHKRWYFIINQATDKLDMFFNWIYNVYEGDIVFYKDIVSVSNFYMQFIS
jgi:hypothetical protein